MSEIAIDIEGLGKRYRLGAARPISRTLGEAVADGVGRLGVVCGRGRASAGRRAESAEARDRRRDRFWAIRDISLAVRRGEVIGIVGANGAGKSTLLKVLSRITDPTEGEARLRGRLASLLEVGTGFHPELSGRENIYLNGAIMGMRKAEIDRQFDAIVDFSGTERFLETPVKRYSSGMRVRLAFAVAAHLEPEILVIDEVLAVGDAAFQQKCLGKMKDIAAGQGRTVLFVSHNMAAIQGLCRRAAWLDGGRLRNVGPADEVVDQYLRGFADRADSPLAQRQDRSGEGLAKLVNCRVSDAESGREGRLSVGRPWRVSVDYITDRPGRKHALHVGLFDRHQRRLAIVKTTQFADAPEIWPGAGTLTVDLPHACTLWPDAYTLNLAIVHGGRVQDFVRGAASFQVVLDESSGIEATTSEDPATLLLPARFQLQAHERRSVA